MKWLTILLTLFIILIILWANTGTMPRVLEVIYDFPGGDKAGHFILYGLLSYLLNKTVMSMLNKKQAKVTLTVTFVLLLLVGIEEWTQQFLPTRTASWVDLVFSYTGIILGAWLAWRSRKNPEKEEASASPRDQ